MAQKKRAKKRKTKKQQKQQEKLILVGIGFHLVFDLWFFPLRLFRNADR